MKEKYKSIVLIPGLVTLTAADYYFRTFDSNGGVYKLENIGADETIKEPVLASAPFNDAYRYVEWLVTVSLPS